MPTVLAAPSTQPPCIFQNGIIYCEQTNFTNHGFSILCFCIVLIILWSKIIVDLSFDHPNFSLLVLLLPFILGLFYFFLT